jgi:hypothetical protein
MVNQDSCFLISGFNTVSTVPAGNLSNAAFVGAKNGESFTL